MDNQTMVKQGKIMVWRSQINEVVHQLQSLQHPYDQHARQYFWCITLCSLHQGCTVLWCKKMWSTITGCSKYTLPLRPQATNTRPIHTYVYSVITTSMVNGQKDGKDIVKSLCKKLKIQTGWKTLEIGQHIRRIFFKSLQSKNIFVNATSTVTF